MIEQHRSMIATLRARWPGPREGSEWSRFAAPIAVAEQALAEAERLARDPNLSDAGRVAEGRRLALSLRPDMARAEGRVADWRGQLSGRRKSLATKVPAELEAEVSALGAEIRAALRAMPAGDRAKLLSEDRLALASALAAPAWLSGAEPDMLAKLAEAANPEAAAEIAMAEPLAEAAEVAVGLGWCALADLAGVEGRAAEAFRENGALPANAKEA